MKITLTIKSVYGVPRAYPACEKSKIIADMLGAKTLTRQAIDAIQALGFSIETTSDASLSDIA